MKISVPFRVPNRTKYLHIHLTIHVKDLYVGNYRMSEKEIKEDLNK